MAQRTCKEDGCSTKHYAQGWCQMHYTRVRRYGDPNTIAFVRHEGTPAERYEAKVNRTAGPDACHPWTAQRDKTTDYPRFVVKWGETVPASRFGWELVNGPIPDGQEVCHHCDNPPCQNPTHWFLDTQAGNMADKVSKGRQQRGEQAGGVKLTEANVIDIRTRYANGGLRQIDLAREYSVSQRAISKIIRGETWTHVA